MTTRGEERDRWAGFRAGRVAFETAGSGEPVIVFVHGWAGSRLHWHRQMSVEDRGRRIAVDLLGHGESDKPEHGYDMDTLAEGVLAVLDELSVQHALLVGHSNGVPVARQVYRRAPERVLGLFAVDGALRREISPEMARWFQETLARPDAESFVASLADQTPRGFLSEEDHELVKAGSRATPLRVHREGLAAMLDERTWIEDPIDVPLLVLRAKPLSEDDLAFIARLNPEARVEVWDDVSHFLMLERPERFEALLGEFVEHL